ncbi:MAG: DUF393 domain-containing protein [Pseudomonadota bacterium]
MSDVTVYYDASCPLCRREIAFFQGRADADFVDISNPDNVPPDLTASAAMARFHVREASVLHQGAAAFAALWRTTPGFKSVGKVAALPGIRHALEGAYRAFLVVRPAIQRVVRGRAAPVKCR